MQALQAAMRAAKSSASAAQTAAANERGAVNGRMLDRPRAQKCATQYEELQQWSDWKYEVWKWLAVQDEACQMEMKVLETERSEPVALSDMGTETKRRSHPFFGALASPLRGRLDRIARPIEDRNGDEAWHFLLEEIELLDRSRGLSLLEALTSPEGWPRHIGDYMDQVSEYEARVSLCEQASGNRFDDDVKITMLVRHAPGEVKTPSAEG